jgi:DNA repair exonuclease SbcCD ATPase subunit
MASIDIYVEELEKLFKEMSETKDEAKVSSKLQEAEELLEQMKIEIHSVSDKAKKTSLQNKMKGWEEQIQKRQRESLIGAPPPAAATSDSERGSQSLATLEAARKQLAETEDVAKDTIGHLGTQRETIKRAQENTRQINQQLSFSNKMLGRMGKWWRG